MGHALNGDAAAQDDDRRRDRPAEGRPGLGAAWSPRRSPTRRPRTPRSSAVGEAASRRRAGLRRDAARRRRLGEPATHAAQGHRALRRGDVHLGRRQQLHRQPDGHRRAQGRRRVGDVRRPERRDPDHAEATRARDPTALRRPTAPAARCGSGPRPSRRSSRASRWSTRRATPTATPAGTYRFVVNGLWRKGNADAPVHAHLGPVRRSSRGTASRSRTPQLDGDRPRHVRRRPERTIVKEQRIRGTSTPLAARRAPFTFTIGPVDFPDAAADQTATGRRFLDNDARLQRATSRDEVEHYCLDCRSATGSTPTGDLTATVTFHTAAATTTSRRCTSTDGHVPHRPRAGQRRDRGRRRSATPGATRAANRSADRSDPRLGRPRVRPAAWPSIRINEFTDPGCPWAWSAEPFRRRIDWLYGDRARVAACTSSASPSRRRTTSRRASRRRRWPARSATIAAEHRMPIATHERPRMAATLPACRAVVAARVHGGERPARALLRAAARPALRAASCSTSPRRSTAAARDARHRPGDAARAGWPTRPSRRRCATTWPPRASRSRPRACSTTSSPTGRAAAATRARATRSSGSRDGVTDRRPGLPAVRGLRRRCSANLLPGPRAARPDPSRSRRCSTGPASPLATQEVAVLLGLSFEGAREELGRVAVETHLGFDGLWTLPRYSRLSIAPSSDRASGARRRRRRRAPRARRARRRPPTQRTPSARAQAMSRGVSPMTSVRSRGCGAPSAPRARARDRPAARAVLVVGAEAALPGGEVSGRCPAARSFIRATGSRLPVTSESRTPSRAASASSSVGDARARRGRRGRRGRARA